MQRFSNRVLVSCLVAASACAHAPATESIPRSDSVAEEIAAATIDIGSPVALDSSGLQALGAAIGDARVVMLGEPWHGDGAAIRLRAALVEYLHRELGFDVLVFEADFYALQKAWREARSTGLVDPVRENLLGFWSHSAASAPLWDYVADRLRIGDTLHVAGVDTRMRGMVTRDSLPGELQRLFLELPGVAADEARRAAGFLAAALGQPNADAELLSDPNYELLLRLLRRLESELEMSEPGSFHGQVVESVRRNLEGGPPDAGMGANLLWLVEQEYPERKLIVWAHNNHIVTDKWMFYEAPDDGIQENVVARLSQQAIGRATYLGEVARHYFGRRLYSIATLTYEGRYSTDVPAVLSGRMADFALTAELAPAPPGTLEHSLARSGIDVGFVDLRPFSGTRDPVSARLLDYTQTPATWLRIWEGFDGLLFLRQTHGLADAGGAE